MLFLWNIFDHLFCTFLANMFAFSLKVAFFTLTLFMTEDPI